MKQTTLKRKQQRTEAIKNKVCMYTKDLLLSKVGNRKWKIIAVWI